MADYTPLPQHLEPHLEAVLDELGKPEPSPSNTVFVVRQALADAYAAGHREGHRQSKNLRWMEENLQTELAKRDQA